MYVGVAGLIFNVFLIIIGVVGVFVVGDVALNKKFAHGWVWIIYL